MDYVGMVMKILEAGLQLWNEKEATKYRDELMQLKKDYYAEKNKLDPNMALLDDIEFRLWVLSGNFATASAPGKPTTPVSSG